MDLFIQIFSINSEKNTIPFH